MQSHWRAKESEIGSNIEMRSNKKKKQKDGGNACGDS